jgi:hypothetical protein
MGGVREGVRWRTEAEPGRRDHHLCRPDNKKSQVLYKWSPSGANKALETLFRHRGMLTDRHEVQQSGAVVYTLDLGAELDKGTKARPGWLTMLSSCGLPRIQDDACRECAFAGPWRAQRDIERRAVFRVATDRSLALPSGDRRP